MDIMSGDIKYPKINIYTDSAGDFECKYICFLAKGISMGEYQNNGFAVIPTLDNNPKSVHFPNLPYSKEFWKSINLNSNKNLSGDYPKSAIDEVKKLLSKQRNDDNNTKLNEIKSDWEKIEKDFFKDLNSFLNFGKALSKVDNINVLITPYGTRGSFNPPRIGNKFNLNVTSRIDQPAGNIAVGILQNLYIIDTWIGGEIGEENYIKRMSAISFLMKNTIFKKYFPDFVDLTKQNYTTNQKLITKSKGFLKKLGFAEKTVELSKSLINLTKQEEQVLKLLENHKGKVVSFDQVARVLWKDKRDDKFSLEAMAKVIEKLRKKIKGIGVNKEVIFTKRGSGYLYI
jgi:DNA-binding winged helix-turn-helix (wHTH) protein